MRFSDFKYIVSWICISGLLLYQLTSRGLLFELTSHISGLFSNIFWLQVI